MKTFIVNFLHSNISDICQTCFEINVKSSVNSISQNITCFCTLNAPFRQDWRPSGMAKLLTFLQKQCALNRHRSSATGRAFFLCLLK